MRHHRLVLLRCSILQSWACVVGCPASRINDNNAIGLPVSYHTLLIPFLPAESGLTSPGTAVGWDIVPNHPVTSSGVTALEDDLIDRRAGLGADQSSDAGGILVSQVHIKRSPAMASPIGWLRHHSHPNDAACADRCDGAAPRKCTYTLVSRMLREAEINCRINVDPQRFQESPLDQLRPPGSAFRRVPDDPGGGAASRRSGRRSVQ